MDGTRSWSILFIAMVQRAAAPIVTGASLYLISIVYGSRFLSEHVALALFAMMFAAICIKPGMPDRSKIRLFSGHIGTIVTGWAIVVSCLLLFGYATKQSAVFSRLTLFTWFLINPFAILFAQWALQEILARVMDLTQSQRKVIIAGITPVSKQLAESIVTDKRLGMTLAGFFEDRNAGRCGEMKHGSMLGRLCDLPSYVKENFIEVIYIALPIRHLVRTRVLLDELQDTTASVYFVPDIFVFDLIQSRVDDIHGLPVLALLETPFYGYNGILKRVSDLFVSSMILLLIFPLMLAIAVAVKMSSPGPVIFKQRRHGLAGEE
ncbi:MAG: sugar transferase, partial [candidate division Zixibacteria bacterium]